MTCVLQEPILSLKPKIAIPDDLIPKKWTKYGEHLTPGWRDEPEVERGDLVIDLFYPPREQGFLALVDFEGPLVGPSVDHAFVVVDPAAEKGAHVKIALSLGRCSPA